MPFAKRIGRVSALDHPGCDQECRDLCFDEIDPVGRRVRLAHGEWRAVLAKRNRQQMASHLSSLSTAITVPEAIQIDPDTDQHLLYYAELPGGRGKLVCLAVKCLPRRFQDGDAQRRYAAVGRPLGRGWGEAWVDSAYFVPDLKPRGIPLWP